MKLSLIHSTDIRQFIRHKQTFLVINSITKNIWSWKFTSFSTYTIPTPSFEGNVISLIDYRNPNDDKLMNEIYAPDQICTNKNS